VLSVVSHDDNPEDRLRERVRRYMNNIVVDEGKTNMCTEKIFAECPTRMRATDPTNNM